ncbi:MAG TPA: SufD family Fe-S cluster assembly protein [Nitrososphaeria archaeon]|nr:SufD family Fe-S cluster assembly protein [Nitrososphaeria archaeon]
MQLDEERLREVLRRPAPLGLDIDLQEFKQAPEQRVEYYEDLAQASLEVGVDLDKRSKLTTFLQVDHEAIYKAVQKQFEKEIELMTLEEALEKYEWLREYVWRLRSPYEDKYSAFNALHGKGGYFLRIREGRRIHLPIQTCFLTYSPEIVQNVHNVIMVEPDAEAYIITGCTAHKKAPKGLHIGVTEIYVKRSAKLNYTMIHKWGPSFHVRPRTGILLEDGAELVYNYITLGSVASFQSQPSARLAGEGATLSMNNVVYLERSSDMDLGGEAFIEGSGGRVELITNAVVADRAKLTNRGRIVCDADNGRGHISCRGLMLSDEAEVSAIPCLVSRRMDSELTHEAAIGRISEEQLFYLMARGISREEAESLIVRGFLDTSPMKLPEHLDKGVRRVIDLAVKGF